MISLLGGNTAGDFSIGTTTGTLVTTTQLDFETTTSYTLVIQAIDRGGAAGAKSATAVVTVTVVNDNEDPPVFSTTT